MSRTSRSIASLFIVAFCLLSFHYALARSETAASYRLPTAVLFRNDLLGLYETAPQGSDVPDGFADWLDEIEPEMVLGARAASETTAPPPGYGRYCSMLYIDGTWAVLALKGRNSTPCEDLLKSKPGGIKVRNGLWATNGKNNVLLQCLGGGVGIWRDDAFTPIQTAFNAAQGQKQCVFTVSPTKLAVFNAPYGKIASYEPNVHSTVTVSNVHDWNIYDVPVNVRDFGQTAVAGHTDAHTFDRKGRQKCRLGTENQCCPDKNDTAKCKPAGCHITNSHGGYDWVMPSGKPIRAVAAGYVVKARTRVVPLCDFASATTQQNEIYIRHLIGGNGYGESLLTYYGHMSSMSVKTGDFVTAGQVIGKNGSSGCSSAPHLHFGVAKLNNTSGFPDTHVTESPGGCGDNSRPWHIDPYGWSAPKHVDPGAWLALGKRYDDCSGKNIQNPGAFSIDLWKSGAAPPNTN